MTANQPKIGSPAPPPPSPRSIRGASAWEPGSPSDRAVALSHIALSRSQVRSRLTAGGRWIRTSSTAAESPGFSAHGGRSLPDSPLEETGFEPEVPAREGWVPLAEGEPSQRRQHAAETVPYLRGPSVRIPVVEAGGRPPPLVFGLD